MCSITCNVQTKKTFIKSLLKSVLKEIYIITAIIILSGAVDVGAWEVFMYIHIAANI